MRNIQSAESKDIALLPWIALLFFWFAALYAYLGGRDILLFVFIGLGIVFALLRLRYRKRPDEFT